MSVTYPTWVNSQLYGLGAKVTYGGANYINLINLNQYRVPPTSPTWWSFYGGSGGSGAVGSIQAGSGIKVDNTTPSAPIVSALTNGGAGITVTPGAPGAPDTIAAAITGVSAGNAGITVTPSTGAEWAVSNAGITSVQGNATTPTLTGDIGIDSGTDITVTQNTSTKRIRIDYAGAPGGVTSITTAGTGLDLQSLATGDVNITGSAVVSASSTVPGLTAAVTAGNLALTGAFVESMTVGANSLTGALVLQGASGVSVSNTGNTVTVGGTFVDSLTVGANSLTGALVLQGASGVSVSNTGNTVTVGGTFVDSMTVGANSLTGALVLQGGSGITVSNTGNTVTVSGATEPVQQTTINGSATDYDVPVTGTITCPSNPSLFNYTMSAGGGSGGGGDFNAGIYFMGGGGGGSGSVATGSIPVTSAYTITYSIASAVNGGSASSPGFSGGNSYFVIGIGSRTGTSKVECVGGFGGMYVDDNHAGTGANGGTTDRALYGPQYSFGGGGGAAFDTTGTAGNPVYLGTVASPTTTGQFSGSNGTVAQGGSGFMNPSSGGLSSLTYPYTAGGGGGGGLGGGQGIGTGFTTGLADGTMGGGGGGGSAGFGTKTAGGAGGAGYLTYWFSAL